MSVAVRFCLAQSGVTPWLAGAERVDFPSSHVPKKPLLLALLLAACAKSGSDGGDVSDDTLHTTSVLAAQVVAFRVPVAGGALSIYSLPSLERTPGGAGSRLSGARSAVGVDLPGRRLLFLDSSGTISSFDLVSLRQKTVAPRRVIATIGADGSLLAVDSSGAVTESQPWGSRTWPGTLGRGVRQVFAAPGPRLIAIRHTRAGDSLSVAGREAGIGEALAVPAATAQAASRDGDAIAFAVDSGILVYEARELSQPWFVRLESTPSAVVFSPSGHRLYVALKDRNELAVLDRFGRRMRETISLPGPATDIRPDPWGLALLVRSGTNGQDADIWVVGTARNTVVGTLNASWASDLPTAAEGGVVLSREGRAIVARDMRTLDSLGAIEGGAGDLWFAGRWIPASPVAAMRAAAAEGRRPTADSVQTPPPAPLAPAASRPPPTAANQPAPVATVEKPATPPAGRPNFWIQLTSTRSESAARALVAELRSPYTQVVPPKTEDDTWRVMVGPFFTRESADSAGRSIGRPYWVVDRAREARPNP